MDGPGRTLVIADGDLGGVVCACIAAGQCPPEAPARDRPVLVYAGPADQTSPARRLAVRALADRLALECLELLATPEDRLLSARPIPDGTGTGTASGLVPGAAADQDTERSTGDAVPVEGREVIAPDGESETTLLLRVAYGAARRGCSRAIWPAHAGLPGEADPSLDRLGAIVDRALLVSRLVLLDAATHHNPGFRVESPLADLTDEQVADLALDLDAPLAACWWWEGGSPGSAEARSRWASAMAALGSPLEWPSRPGAAR